MRRLITLLSLLILPLFLAGSMVVNPYRFAATSHTTPPAFVAETHDDAGTVSTKAVTTSVTTGDTVLAVVDIFGTGISVSSVTGGGTYTLLASYSNVEDGRIRTEIWGVLSATTASSVTVNLSGAANVAISVLRYTGVSAFGNTATAGNAAGVYSDTTHSVSVTMQDTNNLVVHGGSMRSLAAGSAVASVGTIRQNGYTLNQGSVAVFSGDNTAASTGALAVTYTTASPCLWNAVGIELRSN